MTIEALSEMLAWINHVPGWVPRLAGISELLAMAGLPHSWRGDVSSSCRFSQMMLNGGQLDGVSTDHAHSAGAGTASAL